MLKHNFAHLAGTRLTSQEHGATSNLAFLDHFQHDTRGLHTGYSGRWGHFLMNRLPWFTKKGTGQPGADNNATKIREHAGPHLARLGLANHALRDGTWLQRIVQTQASNVRMCTNALNTRHIFHFRHADGVGRGGGHVCVELRCRVPIWGTGTIEIAFTCCGSGIDGMAGLAQVILRYDTR